MGRDEQALKDNTTGYVSLVFAAPLVQSEYAGFGFSGPGQMAGSTAVVITLGATGEPVIQEYFLKAEEPNQVVKDDTRLDVVKPFEAFYNATAQHVFVGFQVDFSRSLAIPNYLIYAQGPASADGSTISYHRVSSLAKLSNSTFPIGMFPIRMLVITLPEMI